MTRVAFVCHSKRGITRERERERESARARCARIFVTICAIRSVIWFFVLLQTPSLLKRASTDKLREVFLKYASLQKDGEHYMTSEDFVRKFLGLFTDSAFNDVSSNSRDSSKTQQQQNKTRVTDNGASLGHCKVIHTVLPVL